MKDTNVNEAIQQLSTILAESGNTISEAYSYWFFWNAIGWMFMGLCIIGAAIKVKKPEEMDDRAALVIKAVLIFIGSLFVFVNLPDLFAPQGIAIHQLIKDIRG